MFLQSQLRVSQLQQAAGIMLSWENCNINDEDCLDETLCEKRDMFK